MQTAHAQSLLSKMMLWLMFLTLLPACSAINTVSTIPFEDYQDAVSTLKQESDHALQVAYQHELDQFKADLAGDDVSNVSSIMLQFPPDDPYAWKYLTDEQGTLKPLFLSMADMQQTLASMNSQLLSYTELLVALAGADENTQLDVQAEAQEFKENASSLVGRLNQFNIDASGVGPQGLALFSTAAALSAEAFLENKRKALLVGVLRAGVEPLETFVKKAQEATSITAQGVKDQYQDQIKNAVRASIAAKGEDRIKSLEQLLALNDDSTQQLELLSNIHKSYGALPHSHRRLITAVDQGRQVNLAELKSYIVNIKQQIGNLKHADEMTSNQ